MRIITKVTFKPRFRIAPLLCVAAGAALACVTVLLSFKAAFLIAAAAGFAIFTLKYIELSLSLFVFGMAVVPHNMWNNMYIMFAAFFYFGVYSVLSLTGKKKGFAGKYIYPSFVFYIAFSLVSLVFTNFLSDSLRVLALTFSCIMFFVLVQNIITDKKSMYIFTAFIAAAVLVTCFSGVSQMISGVEIRSEFVDTVANVDMPGRIYSTMDNPNNYAEYLVMSLPVIAAVILNLKSDAKRIIFAPIFVLASAVLVMTFSRSSYLAFVAAFAVMLVMLNKKLVPLVFLFVLVVIPFLPSVLIARVSTIGTDTSSTYRLTIWEGVFRMIKSFPVTGIGIGPSNFTSVYKNYANVEAFNAMHSHNVFLNVWIELGIFGLLSFAAFLLKIVRDAFSAFRGNISRETKNLLAGGVGGLTAFVVTGLVEYVWYYPRVMLTFWILCGITVSAVRIARSENETSAG